MKKGPLLAPFSGLCLAIHFAAAFAHGSTGKIYVNLFRHAEHF
jgi:hypothetical protein